MGFWSLQCEGCGHPLLSFYAVEDGRAREWMSHVVAVGPEELGAARISKGVYDGYGRLDEDDSKTIDDRTVWHEACWEAAGRPVDYLGESERAPDQGWFFRKSEHDIPPPTHEGDSE